MTSRNRGFSHKPEIGELLTTEPVDKSYSYPLSQDTTHETDITPRAVVTNALERKRRPEGKEREIGKNVEAESSR